MNAKHSASVSRIDEKQVFYMMTRGIDQKTAERMITEGTLLYQFSDTDEKIKKIFEKIVEEEV